MKATVVFLSLALGVAHTPIALAQSPATFRATGDMTSARFLHTATLLADGRVLIAGGIGRGGNSDVGTLATAELFDPAKGTFSPTGRMSTPRDGHTATLLPDGSVLIAGGWPRGPGTDGRSLASAEIYNPSTGTFTRTGGMTEGRSNHTATLLNNGRVLIAGGLAGLPGGFLASAELYDPSTGTFVATGAMTRPWADTATLLPNGKVLITRGNPQEPGPYVSSAELYDASSGTFTHAGYLNANHTAPTAVLLTNGQVLIAGGDIGDGDGASVIAELYDPSTGLFSRTGSLAMGREQHTATLLPDGSVLFAGGHSLPALAVKSELYDPVQGTFSATGDMTTARELHTATLLRSGEVLIAGGDDQRYWIPETYLSSAEFYSPRVLAPAPALLAVSGDGQGQGAILYANTARIASRDHPAGSGEALEIYFTGLRSGTVIPPQVSIGGRLAEVLWFGNAPGYAGLNQINVLVPGGVAPGPAVPVRLTYIGRPSNEVTIAVR